MPAVPNTPILIYTPEGGFSTGPVSNPPLYSQADITQLVEGQAYIDVVFGSTQTDDQWVLVACEVENTTDFEPLNIWPGIITDRTTAGFRLQLNGMPDSSNYYLHWAVSGINITPVSATLYFLTGPTSGGFGVASTFTVTLPPSTTLAAPVVVTPSDGGGGGGGAFSPTFVTLTTGSPTQTFTYTPASYGAKTISTTNSGPLTNPANVVFNVIATTYTLTGPSSGVSGVASTNFTVALPVGGAVLGTLTVTPHATGGGTFTPTTLNLTTGAPSATFTYTPSTAGAKTISVTNNGGLTDPGSLTYTASSPALWVSLISYWKLDEASGTRVDSFGSNHLTDNNSTGSTTGKINNAAIFHSGSSNYLSCASNSSLQVAGNTDFTFSAWIKLLDVTIDHSLITKDDSAANSRDYTIDYDVANGLRLYTKGQVPNPGVLTGVGTVGTWYHVVAWYDSSNGQFHIRINDTTTYNSPTGATATDVSAAQFRIGARQYSGFPDYADAVIDEVGFWKRILTSGEITALYNGGAGLPFASFP